MEDERVLGTVRKDFTGQPRTELSGVVCAKPLRQECAWNGWSRVTHMRSKR